MGPQSDELVMAEVVRQDHHLGGAGRRALISKPGQEFADREVRERVSDDDEVEADLTDQVKGGPP